MCATHECRLAHTFDRLKHQRAQVAIAREEHEQPHVRKHHLHNQTHACRIVLGDLCVHLYSIEIKHSSASIGGAKMANADGVLIVRVVK
jgi:hypothetical protein